MRLRTTVFKFVFLICLRLKSDVQISFQMLTNDTLLKLAPSSPSPFPCSSRSSLSFSLSLSFLFCSRHHSLSQFVSQYPKVVYLTDKMILFLEMTGFCRHQRPPALPVLSPAARSRCHFFQVPVNAGQTDRLTHI